MDMYKRDTSVYSTNNNAYLQEQISDISALHCMNKNKYIFYESHILINNRQIQPPQKSNCATTTTSNSATTKSNSATKKIEQCNKINLKNCSSPDQATKITASVHTKRKTGYKKMKKNQTSSKEKRNVCHCLVGL